MGVYFLSIGTGKVHKSGCPCKSQMNTENYKEFPSLDAIKQSTEKYITRCKRCMRDENESWSKVFGVHK